METEVLQEMLRGIANAYNTKPVPILLTVRELNLGGIERDIAKVVLALDRTGFASSRPPAQPLRRRWKCERGG